MRKPNLYAVDTLKFWGTNRQNKNGTWSPARPVGYDSISLSWRLKLATLVFFGRCDAVDWHEET